MKDIKNLDKLTHLHYAFAHIKEGKIVLGDPWADVRVGLNGRPSCWDANIPDDQCQSGNFYELQELKKTYPHLKILITVGGANEYQTREFALAASTPQGRQNFAQSTVQFLKHWKFDGIDIDWEFPSTPEDQTNFTLLMAELRQQMNKAKAGWTLVATIGPGMKHAKFIEGAALNASVDFFNMMAYDYNGAQFSPVTGHLAPLYYDEKAPNASENYIDWVVNEYLHQGIPPEKLVLGIPLYGRSFGGVNGKDYGEYQSFNPIETPNGTWDEGKDYTGILDVTDIRQNYLNKRGYTRHWNDISKTAYAFNPLTKVFISYEDAESVSYKAKYIQENKLGGATFWDLSGDRNGQLIGEVLQTLNFKH
ncbi:glycoside hydrolase family 18 protein [Ammoniphilus resinae]|uniref:chitinase n=1 Tax=Ammoniphilus resinae TaxID=861532 RepID=A0ABS4GQS8_9BACL|nr:chitinase [Ammoniphilus resinae]